MYVYSLTEVAKLGQHDQKYGTKYWCRAEERPDTPISFNSMNQDIDVGDVITAEEYANRKSAKGTEYLQLKKVKLGERVGETPPKPVQPAVEVTSTVANDQILDALRKLYAHQEAVQQALEAKLDTLLGIDAELSEKPASEPQNGPQSKIDEVYDLDGEPLPPEPEDDYYNLTDEEGNKIPF